MTYTATALYLASLAATNQEARRRMPDAVDAGYDELVAAGKPRDAELFVQRCLLLANWSTRRTLVRGHLSGSGHLSASGTPK